MKKLLRDNNLIFFSRLFRSQKVVKLTILLFIIAAISLAVYLPQQQQELKTWAAATYDPTNYCTQKVGEDVESEPDFLTNRDAYWNARLNEINSVAPTLTATRDATLDATVMGGVACDAYRVKFNGAFGFQLVSTIPLVVNGTNTPLKIDGIVWVPRDLGLTEKRPGVILHEGFPSSMDAWKFDPADPTNPKSPNATYWGGQLCSKYRAVAMQYDYQGVGLTGGDPANANRYPDPFSVNYIDSNNPGYIILTLTITDPSNPDQKGKYWYPASHMQTLYQAGRALESTGKVCINTPNGSGKGLVLGGFSAGAGADVGTGQLDGAMSQKWHLALGGTPARVSVTDLFRLPEAQKILVPYMDQFATGSAERKHVCRMLAYVNPHRLAQRFQNKDMLFWVGDQDEVYLYQGNLDMYPKIPGPPTNTKSLIVESGAAHDINKFMNNLSVNNFLSTNLANCN